VKALLLLLVVAACTRGIGPVVVAPVVPLKPAPVFQPEKRGRVVVTDTDIEILDTISFVGNTAQIAPASTRILDAIAQTMVGNPTILLMEIRGHSDWEEPDRVLRAQLSIQRAEAVVAELVARGVSAARLQAYGASDSEPLSMTDPIKNRRIELLILERDSD
jgi:outer membrane protein OmpA-like peptidoglycan-associated protein